MGAQMKAIADKLLTGVSMGYMPKSLVADRVLPKVFHDQYSGLLGKYGTAHLRIENTLKGGRGKYRRMETQVRTTTNFLIEGHGLEGLVTKQDYANVQDPFNAERDETLGLTTVIALEKEKALADVLGSTSIMTQSTTLSGTSQFSDYNNSNPLKVIADGINSVLDNSGAAVNKMIMDKKVFNILKFHPMLLDALGFKFSRPGGLSAVEMAEAFDVEELVIADAAYESAKEGQTSSLARVWGKDIILVCAPNAAEIMQKSIGYEVRLRGSSPRQVYKFPKDNPPGSNAILVEDEYDQLIADVKCGYLVKSAIA